jgi:hypothetical protein
MKTLRRTQGGRNRTGARSERNPPLWRCPRCGHRFVTRNAWHSCSNHTLAEHFRGCAPSLRPLFDRYLAFLRSLGPVTVIPQATRITFQARVRFAGAVVRRDWIEGGLWLKRRVDDDRFTRAEHISGDDWVYRFRLERLSDLDAAVKRYLREAYEVGRQRAAGADRGRKGTNE